MLITNATLVTVRQGEPVVLPDHEVLVEDGVIRSVAPSGVCSCQGIDEIIDARSLVVVPGLINTHHHLYQSLTRGLAAVQNAPLFAWLTELYPRWRRMDYEAVKLAASVSIAELLLSGCTTTSDHLYIFPPGSGLRVEAVIEAADELGIRIHACRGSMSVGASGGGLPPDDCVESESGILADCRRGIDEFHDPGPYAMRRIDLAPCSPFSISPELLDDTRELARERNVLLHTHAAETLDEQAYCLERFGQRPVAFLAEHGWLGEDVYLAHCVHLNDEEIELLARTRTGVSHCPCSNMRLGSGVAPISRLIELGGKVGIGVDGSSSNDGGNLLAEVRQALLLQRAGGGPEAITTAQAFALATTGGAAVLGRDRLGRIEPEMAADLALYRKDEIALAGAIEQDPLGALMLCHAPRPDRVIVAGRTVVRQGHLADTDEHALAARLNELVAKAFH